MKISTTLILLLVNISFAKIEINTEVVPSNVTIGDSVYFQIRVELPPEQAANYPDLQFDENNIKLLDKILSSNSVKYVFSFWESGEIIIPEIPIQIIQNGEIIDEVYSNQQKIIVSSMLSDSSSSIRPIKDMQDIKLGSSLVLVYIGILGLSLIVVFILWKKRQRTILKIQKYKTPPETAINRCKRRLSEVKIPFPITPETTEKYYVELSEIFREYIGAIHYVKSLEMTTSEFKIFLEGCKIDKKSKQETFRLLDRADLGKYAKHLPSEDELKADKKAVEILTVE